MQNSSFVRRQTIFKLKYVAQYATTAKHFPLTGQTEGNLHAPLLLNTETFNLPFVNRHAEVFDVMSSCLSTAAGFTDPDQKRRISVATQTRGTGKTFLGRNLIFALNRPREASADIESHVAQRLLNSLTLQSLHSSGADDIIRSAVELDHDESLCTRALRIFLRFHVLRADELVDAAKDCRTVFVRCGAIGSQMANFEHALAYAILQSATGDVGVKWYSRLENNNFDIETLCKTLVDCYGPMFFVFDEISFLGNLKYQKYFGKMHRKSDNEGLFFPAMYILSQAIQQILEVPKCFVYCTGRSSLVGMRALSGNASPLLTSPVIIHPLKVADVQEIINARPANFENACASLAAVDADVRDYFIARLVELTGGNGRLIQDSLASLNIMKVPPTSCKQIIESHLSFIGGSFSIEDQLKPKEYMKNPSMPRVSNKIAELLLFENTFDLYDTVNFEDENVRLVDLLSVFGFSYAPVHGKASSQMQIVVGEWQLESLIREFKQTDPLSMFSILHEMAKIPAGTGRGIHFENLCFQAFRRMCAINDNPIEVVLPHLIDSYAATERLFSSRELETIMLPKVIPSGDFGLGDFESNFFNDRSELKVLASINLPRVLSEWAVPGMLILTRAESFSQDLFYRYSEGVLGMAMKAHHMDTSSPTGWAAIRDELSKAVDMSRFRLKYTLVLYSTQLAPQVAKAVGQRDSVRCGPGHWGLSACGELVMRTKALKVKSLFKISKGQELVIVNPDPAVPGGLSALLGQRLSHLVTHTSLEGSMLMNLIRRY